MIDEEEPKYYVITAHAQRVYLVPGDWILPEPDGEGYYPCKDDIFKATYEPVETDALELGAAARAAGIVK
jgi:hypothetical protein